VGRNAPLSFSGREKATHAAHVWDFFKPDHTTEYPIVDGQLSQVCYYQALEDVYTRFCQKMEKSISSTRTNNNNNNKETAEAKQQPLQLFDATSADYFVFHSPYNKLVQKSYARLFLMDARRQHERQQQQQAGRKSPPLDAAAAAAALEEKNEASKDMTTNTNSNINDNDNNPLQEWLEKPIQDTYNDKALEKLLQTLSKQSYQQRLTDANAASQVVGNTYTASVFLGLASLIDRQGRLRDDENDNDDDGGLTPGKSIVVFSYGSGALATMYRLQV
jgi:hydroxymethylglutaryl-CoA synthase